MVSISGLEEKRPGLDVLKGFEDAASAETLATGEPQLPDKLLELPRKHGKIRWYNGRRRQGVVIGDDGQDWLIPTGGAVNGNQCPPTSGGLVHGTRVSYTPVPQKAGCDTHTCVDVRPREDCGHQPGATCGVETRLGGRESNEDRLVAADVADIGFLAAVFDGHGGEKCVDFVRKHLPSMVHTMFGILAKRASANTAPLSRQGEEDMIGSALRKAFEATERDWMRVAKQTRNQSGTTALLVLLAHGFEATEAETTVPGVTGGVSRLFVAWCGDCRALMLRGRSAVRLSEDHKPENAEESARIRAAGGMVADSAGVARVGRKRGRNECWLSTSRSFGDLELKDPTALVVADPDIRVETVTPEDWAIVLGCDGVFNVLSDQQVADSCFQTMLSRGGGPVEAARAVADLATTMGSLDNITVVVMRLEWASIPKLVWV